MATSVSDPPTEGSPEPRPHRPWYRRRLVVALAIVVVVLLAGGAAFGVLWSRRGAHEASVESAIERFRENGGDAGGDQPMSLRPVPGVYTYAGSGSEHLSFLSTSQSQGPTLPASVVRGTDGCWTFRIDYSTNHWQDWDYCLEGDTLVERGGHTFQRFDFVATKLDNLTTFTCDPPSSTIRPEAKVGATWSQRCTGTSDSVSGTVVSAGTSTYLGPGTVDVGGTAVPAYHYRQVRTLSGAQGGTSTYELWFARSTGLPLRNDRQVEVVSPAPAPLHSVTYTEQGSFRLASLTPRH